MLMAGKHDSQWSIAGFVASMPLLGIAVGGAADEVICCPINSDLASVKYATASATGWASVDIELPQAVDWTEPTEAEDLRDDGASESSCAEGRYDAVSPSTRRSEVFEFNELHLRVEPAEGDSGRLKIFLPIRMYGHHDGVDEDRRDHYVGRPGMVHTRLRWANRQGDTMAIRASYLLQSDEYGGCVAVLEFEIEPPAADVRPPDSENRFPDTRDLGDPDTGRSAALKTDMNTAP